MDRSGSRIQGSSTREVFEELLTGALSDLGTRPSPLATTYLLDLLEDGLRRTAGVGRAREGDETLGEALLRARQEAGPARVRRLRDLGDRALFSAGLFGDSLRRSLVDIDYVGRVGQTAYVGVARSLGQGSWTALFDELGRGFFVFVDVLAEVGDRTRGGRDPDLLRIYERYLATGSERERRRLVRRGLAPPDRAAHRRPQ